MSRIDDMKKALKIFLIIFSIIILLIAGLLLFLWYVVYKAPMVPDDYTDKTQTGGIIEKTYLGIGTYKTAYFEEKSDNEAIEKYEVWYPEELENSLVQYPVVIVVNGTGVFASKAKPLFEHLASWGFIVIGNQDPSTWNGNTADMTLQYIIEANNNEDSIFYKRVDIKNIGITGHSQGGVAVFNAINENQHGNMYKCAVSLSPTEEEMAKVLKIPYDPTKTQIPIMLLAGTENDVISSEKMTEMYKRITAPKIMAIKKEQNHGEMLYSADGYVTAWFMWQLQGDKEAAKAFIGDAPEIINNELYQDQRIDIK